MCVDVCVHMHNYVCICVRGHLCACMSSFVFRIVLESEDRFVVGEWLGPEDCIHPPVSEAWRGAGMLWLHQTPPTQFISAGIASQSVHASVRPKVIILCSSCNHFNNDLWDSSSRRKTMERTRRRTSKRRKTMRNMRKRSGIRHRLMVDWTSPSS